MTRLAPDAGKIDFDPPNFFVKTLFLYIFPGLQHDFYGFPGLPPGTWDLKINFLIPKNPQNQKKTRKTNKSKFLRKEPGKKRKNRGKRGKS